MPSVGFVWYLCSVYTIHLWWFWDSLCYWVVKGFSTLSTKRFAIMMRPRLNMGYAQTVNHHLNSFLQCNRPIRGMFRMIIFRTKPWHFRAVWRTLSYHAFCTSESVFMSTLAVHSSRKTILWWAIRMRAMQISWTVPAEKLDPFLRSWAGDSLMTLLWKTTAFLPY